jgi:hypothetical protein
VVEIRKILITGILEKILDVGVEIIREHIEATDFGIAEKRRTVYFDILVKDGDIEEKIRYEGIILGASLGNNVEVHELEYEGKKRIEIYDFTLGKWYQ